MTTPTQPLTLSLSSTGSEEYLQLHFAGLLSDDMTTSRRHRFLRLASLLAWPAPLRGAIFAKESGGWDWAQDWTSALEEMKGGLELRFKVREARRGR